MKKKNYFSRIRGIGRAFLLVVAMSATSYASAVDIITGLKLYYDFEAMDGGVVADASGNAQEGQIMGTGTTAAAGYNSAQGVSFATVASPAVDYVKLPDGITGALNDFTVAAWVKLTNNNQWARVFDFGNGTSNYMFLTVSSGTTVRFAFKNVAGTTGTTEQTINGTAKLPIGKWTHVAVTCAYDPVTLKGTGKLYVNGSIVGTNSNITITPSMLDLSTPTNQNYIGKSQWPDNALIGTVDEFRIYDRALTDGDIMTLSGTPAELITQWQNLSLGDLSDVKKKLNLPTTLGTGGVTVKWASTNNGAIDTLGNVIIPPKFDAIVILTATVSLKVDTTTFKLTKSFTANVLAVAPAPDEVAKWNFVDGNISTTGGVVTVKDEFTSGFVGTVMNDARIRTIGTTTKFNVLDLGNGTGYFDMGKDIGEQIYSLNNYTMSAYFRVANDYTLGAAGNFLWTFSNSADSPTDKNGYIIGTLNSQDMSITPGYWEGNEAIGVGKNAPKGSWHHMAYVQDGTTGTIFIDGVKSATGTIDFLPSIVLNKNLPGVTGTPYNWLGRSCYPSDGYLKKTLVYGFSLYRIVMTAENLTNYLNVPTVISDLNAAYAQDSDVKSPAVDLEAANLTLGNLSAVTSNVTLPSVGTLDPTVLIAWKSSLPAVIGNDGVVTRPDYYNCSTVTLTATLSKGLVKATKSFPATVLAKAGTQFTSADSLLVKYDFATVANDTVVTDAAEKHFTGIAKQGAKVKTIGTTAPVKILALGDSIGYFDMGTQMGSIVNHLTNYTMGAFFRVDASYTDLAKNGNFLWNFSNTSNAGSNNNGYLIAILGSQRQTISAGAGSTEQSVSLKTPASQGGWHHFAYTQQDNNGVLYIDGGAIAIGDMPVTPATGLSKDGIIGTIYNWLGRSCWLANGDVYLRKTLVSDFRIYKRALSADEIATTLMNVQATIPALDKAYNETPIYAALKTVKESQYKVTSTQGKIQIIGLTGNEKLALYDITGRQIMFNTPNNISVKSGIYIVRINNFASKVLVK